MNEYPSKTEASENAGYQVDFKRLEERVMSSHEWPSLKVKEDYYRALYSTTPDPIILTEEEYAKLYCREEEGQDSGRPIIPILYSF